MLDLNQIHISWDRMATPPPPHSTTFEERVGDGHYCAGSINYRVTNCLSQISYDIAIYYIVYDIYSIDIYNTHNYDYNKHKKHEYNVIY